ncbi:hypothetical protein DSO57_1015202 [Entomophthora muscae]|uniref:Uncharacterized protein n=1 Tax=Entomophthora muscae TaxID=34485 RepID=A0ACC2S7A9_9FUNG|nr:hypothetical protein DSO57_1015202 [Entomophthora muscae]
MNNINYNIVAGMDWFTQVNSSVCWKTKTMTIKRNGVNFNILKEPNDLILRDIVFVQVINKDNSERLTKDSTLHIMRYTEFNNMQPTKIHYPELVALLNKYTHVFKEELTELLPKQEVKHGIDLCKAMPKHAVVNAAIHCVLILPLLGYFEDKSLSFSFALQNEAGSELGNTIAQFPDSAQLTCPTHACGK